MSLWRKEASTRLPELQHVVSSPRIDNPMMLWIELNMTFTRICDDPSPSPDLLRRIWGYGLWCLDHRDDDVSTAAAVGFFEHAIDSPSRIAQLSVTTTRPVIEGFRNLLAYHHTEEEIRAALARAFPDACPTQKR
jgi:hypothetical protein